ncbi:MAG: DNA-directed RNA polymerase subunit P [Candidatus Micrarchaeia archaeon]
MAYTCVKCGKVINKIGNFVRCPYCGGKILVKSRPQIPREIKTD